MLPLLRIRLCNVGNLTQHAVVENQAIKAAERLQGQVNGLLAEREVRQIAGQDLDLGGVLVFQLLEGLRATGHHNHIVGLRRREEELSRCETDTCTVDRIFSVDDCLYRR